MALKIKLLRAPTLDELELTVNRFIEEMASDVRISVDLVGGITYIENEYVAPVRISAPYKRSFTEE